VSVGDIAPVPARRSRRREPPPQLPLVEIDGSRSVERYDPVRGLQTIVVAEAAEKQFARAKDATKLFEAIELKLTEQRNFIRWYDEQPKDPGTRGQIANRDAAGRIVVPGADSTVSAGLVSIPAIFGLDPADERTINNHEVMLSRWRSALKTDADFLIALDEARRRVIRICEQEPIGTVRGTEGTGEFELYTPARYIEAARTVMGGIDLDPASNDIAQQTIRAGEYFTPESDGLEREWRGRVWLNPPYHRELLPAFVEKLVAEVAAERVSAAIMLTNNCTDTHWFLAAETVCQAICFTTGRIRFLQRGAQEVAPTQGQAFFYFGSDVDRFAEVFGAIGFSVVPR
jgi:DNA N-6-adenine-methyltransferase (Dam)